MRHLLAGIKTKKKAHSNRELSVPKWVDVFRLYYKHLYAQNNNNKQRIFSSECVYITSDSPKEYK